MSTELKTSPHTQKCSPTAPNIPPLESGDRLTRDEVMRRYETRPDINTAQLIEGVVHKPSAVRAIQHGEPHSDLNAFLAGYRAMTPGVVSGDNSTLQLDVDNAPQPDAYLRITPEAGGHSHIDDDGYVEGAPELIAEVAASSVSYDLHDQLNAYRRNGVREYLLWRVQDQAFDWFVLRQGRYDRLPVTDDRVGRSQVFPGLWLDTVALLTGDLAKVLAVLQQGLAADEHQQFIATLQAKAESPPHPTSP